MIRWLLESGAAIEARNIHRATPLYLAAQGGQQDAVTALLAAGADPNAAAFDGSTPLAAAVAKGHERVASLLRARGGR
jgi:ankyrin repeat protein